MKRCTLARDRDEVHGTVEIVSLWTACRINLTQRALEEQPQATHLQVNCSGCLKRMGIGAGLAVTSQLRRVA